MGDDGVTRQIELESWILAEPTKVFEAVTTRAGLDAWWGKVSSAEPTLGHVVEFDHGLGAPLQMRITEFEPGQRIAWRCVSDFSDSENPASEWLGTSIRFSLRSGVGEPAAQWMGPRLGWSRQNDEDFTILEFQHVDWPASSRWLPFCAGGWAQALAGLTRHCEQD
jgi:uncharacterized protein YndB with AHSA1/START domain